MEKKALIVAEAAGPDDVVNPVLRRFGFGGSDAVPTFAAAAARLRTGHYDLLVVPLQDMTSVDLTILERDLRREGTSYVIGTAPNAEPDLILRAMRSGIQEFLVFPPDANDLAAALDRLVRRSAGDQQKGQVIAVYSAKGGMGSTSVAVNLAYGFARNLPDRRVAIADLVVSGGEVRVLLDLKPSYDIGDLVSKVDRVDEELLFSVLTPTSGGVWALAASENPEVTEMLDATAASAIISHLRANFAVTVLDCEHSLSDRTLAALDAADRVVLVTQLTVPGVRSAKRTLDLFERLGYQDPKVVTIVNRHNGGDAVGVHDAREVMGRDVYWKIPNDYRAFSDALTRGIPVLERDPTAAISKSFVQLAAKLGGTGAPTVAGTNGKQTPSRLGRLLRMGRKE